MRVVVASLIQDTVEGLKEIEILRVGKHTAMNGVTQEFTHEILDEIVSTYNPDYFKAPLIISHETGNYSDRSIAETELAYGTPKFLKKVGDRLKAVFAKIAPAFTDWQRNDQILGISPSFYPPSHPSNPYPHKWSLRHIAGLGKSPPAIKGLAPMSLNEFLNADANNTVISFGEFRIAPDKGTFTVKPALDFMMGDRFISMLFSKLRDYLIDKESLDTADKILPSDLVQMIAESATVPDYKSEMLDRLMMRVSELEAKIFPPQPIYTEQPMSEETKEKEINFEERQRQLEFQQAELAKQAQQLAARQAEFDRKEDLDFCEGLIKEGKALPKEKNNLMAIFTSLRKSESTVDFGEGKETSAIEAVKSFMRDRPPVIAFGEYSAPDKAPSRSTSSFSVPEGHEVDPEALEVHEKAMQYMETHPNVTYIQAIAKVGG